MGTLEKEINPKANIKQRKDFKVLLLYPNLSMLFAPPLALAIFTTIYKSIGYKVDIFDTTPYVGDGATAMEGQSLRDYEEDEASKKIRSKLAKKNDVTFQIKSTEENMTEMLQSRPFSFEDDLGVERKTGLHKDFVKKVNEFKPDFILCSVVEDTFLQAVNLISLVKHLNIPVCYGGVFITAAPEVAIKYPEVELLCLGEGENVVGELTERIRKKESYDDLPSLWIKKDDHNIKKNPRGHVVLDFMKIIPDYSLFDSKRFYRQMGGKNFKSVTIESYRGCPYTCAYCNSPMQTNKAKDEGIGVFLRRAKFHKYRDYLLKIIETVQPTYFMFADDSFLARPKKEIEEFCKMYSEFKIPFWFNTRPENITEESLKMLKDVNCHRIALGIECGNEEFRSKVLLRNTKNKHIIDKFEVLANGEIPFSVNNIIGFPDETRELIFETIELNRQIEAYDAMSVTVFVPYHGTVLRDICVQKGYIDPNEIVKDLHHSILNQPSISTDEINGLLKTFPLYVHFDKNMWDDIGIAEKETTEGKKLFDELKEIYQKEFFEVDQDTKLNKFKLNKTKNQSYATQ